MNNILRFATVLFLVNLVAASILAGVYYVTKLKIETQERLVKEEALREVMPESIGDRLEGVERDPKIGYWKCLKAMIPGFAAMCLLQKNMVIQAL